MRMVGLLALLLLGPLVLPRSSSAQESPAATSKPAVSVPTPDTSGVYHAGNGVSQPKIVYQMPPVYPEEASKKKLSGKCVVSLVVDTDGHVRDLRVIYSIAEDQPKKLQAAALKMDEKAMEAVRQFRFEPGLLEGKPVPVAISVEVGYQIF